MSEPYSQLKFSETKLSNGWKAKLSTDEYPLEAWAETLSDIDALLSDPVETFRDHENSTVMRKDITIAGKTIPVTIKHEKPGKSMADWLRAVRPARSFRFLKLSSGEVSLKSSALIPLKIGVSFDLGTPLFIRSFLIPLQSTVT